MTTSRTEFARAVGSARPEEAHRLRHEAQRWLTGLDLLPDDRERVVAAVSEAVENAVEHAYDADREAGSDTVELTVWAEKDAVNVQVVDHGQWREPDAERRVPETPARRGRGFVLMHRSIDSVSIRHTANGTTVALRHHLGSGPADDVSG